MRSVTRLSWVTSVTIARGRLEAWAQHGAFRHQAVLEIAPQCNHELARQRHDGDAPHASFLIADAGAEPMGELAVRLMVEPAPGELDGERARAAVAGLA